jgi:hypothetical protein
MGPSSRHVPVNLNVLIAGVGLAATANELLNPQPEEVHRTDIISSLSWATPVGLKNILQGGIDITRNMLEVILWHSILPFYGTRGVISMAQMPAGRIYMEARKFPVISHASGVLNQ